MCCWVQGQLPGLTGASGACSHGVSSQDSHMLCCCSVASLYISPVPCVVWVPGQLPGLTGASGACSHGVGSQDSHPGVDLQTLLAAASSTARYL